VLGFRNTIRRKLTLLVAVGVVALVVVLTAAVDYVGRQMLEEQIHARLRLYASERQALLNSYIGRQEERLALVSSRTRLRQLLADHAAAEQEGEKPGRLTFEEFQAETRQILLDAVQSIDRDGESRGAVGKFLALSIADARGRIVTSTRGATGEETVLADEAFRAGLAGSYLGMPRTIDGAPRVTLSGPLVLDGQTRFVLLAIAEAEPLLQVLTPPPGMDTTSELQVGVRRGDKIHLLAPPRLGGGVEFTAEELPLLARGLDGEFSDSTKLLRMSDRRGSDVLATFRPLGYQGWGLLAKIDVAEAHAPLANLRRAVFALGGALLIWGLVGAYLLSRQFTQPIVELAEQADRLADGKFDARVHVRSRDELGKLQSAFNRMVEQLARSYAELESRVRQRTAELDRERNLMHALMDHHPDVIYFKDLESRFLKISGALAERLKLADPADAVGKTDADFFPVEYAWQALEDERKLLQSGKPLVGKEERPTWPDGTKSWVSTTKTLLRDGEGKVIGTFGISHDINAQKLAQEALRHSEQRTRLIIDTANDAFVAMDARGDVIDWNSQAEITFGWKRDEIVGRSLAETIIPPQYREAHTAGLRHFLATKVGPLLNTRIEITALHRDGQEFPIELTISPVRLGEAYVFNAFVHDISGRKRAERRLAAQHAATRILAESGTLREAATSLLQVMCEGLGWDVGALWTVDEAADVLRCVEFWQRPEHAVTGFARATRQSQFPPGVGLPGRVWANGAPAWIPDVTRDSNFPRAPHAAEEGLHAALGFPIRLGDKVLGAIEFFSRDIRQPDKALLEMFAAVGSQIGLFLERQQANEGLLAAKEAAEAANRAKSVFLATMSHEIRTPMNAILGMTELVLDSPLSAQQREYLKLVQESGESLLTVINDVLDFSKIEAGRVDLDALPLDLHETVGDTMKSLAVRAHAKGLELTYEIAPDVPQGLVGDRARLRQVIVNLVGNSIKFTHEGEVVLTVAREAGDAREALLHFTVRDTGIGIPADRREMIFESFRQADSSTTRQYGGTGLGLAICAKLVELMGGRIWVESEVGRGSEFHFTARLGVCDEPPAEPPRAAVPLQGLRVLVVDDNATNRRILEEVLRNWRMLPTAVAGASEALAALRAAQAGGQAFELVLTDCHMPQTDGFDLARQIQQDDRLRSAVIMMLTSGETPGAGSQCDELGISAYLLKPVKQSELFDAIVAALGAVAPDEEPQAAAARRLRGLRILLAEDSLVNQKLAIALLERQGHSVTVVGNGREALAAVQAQEFDVVLMDVQMPELDGLQAAAAIRRHERSRGGHVPIIAMTAHALRGDRERCLEAGMDDYVSKPIRSRELLDAIERAVGPTALSSEADTTRPASGAAEQAPVIDWDAALRAVNGDRHLLRDLAEAFLTEAPQRVAEIRRALASGDATSLRRAAHTIKSSARYFGAADVYQQAERLEMLAKQGELAPAAPVSDALITAVEQLTAALVKFVEESDNSRGQESGDRSQ
jgi:two-component system sensor histidine kinase/response regulator